MKSANRSEIITIQWLGIMYSNFYREEILGNMLIIIFFCESRRLKGNFLHLTFTDDGLLLEIQLPLPWKEYLIMSCHSTCVIDLFGSLDHIVLWLYAMKK